MLHQTITNNFNDYHSPSATPCNMNATWTLPASTHIRLLSRVGED
jgi:hypothetical protein